MLPGTSAILTSLFRSALVCLLLGGSPLAPAQTVSETGLKPEVLLLARVKTRMEAVLKQQPNYTCVETIQRSVRRAPAQRFQMLDTLRLEVALVNGAEMFSWPGESEFRSADVTDIVTSGAIGSGDFATHPRSVFLSNTARFEYAGPEVLNMRQCQRYNYRVPLNLSGYTIRSQGREAIVAYHGSFWVEEETLDLVRLDVHADVIPYDLNLAAADTELWYERFEIGNSEFLLPSLGITKLTHLDGDVSRNETRFSDCRQYTGESVLSFAEPDTEPTAPAPAEWVTLPGGLNLDLAFETPIEDGLTAVGDEVRTRVTRDVNKRGSRIIPKGALVKGRVIHFERHQQGTPYFALGIQLEEIEFDGKRAEIAPEFVRYVSFLSGGEKPVTDVTRLFPRGGARYVETQRLREVPGAALIYVKGGKLRIPPGSRMIWRIRNSTNGENK